jgi:hypothetical protein
MVKPGRRKCLVLALLVGPIAGYFALLFMQGTGNTEFNRIRVGMAWSEVHAIVGQPNGGAVTGNPNTIALVWDVWHGSIVLTMSTEGQWNVIEKKHLWHEPVTLYLRRRLGW